MKKIDVILAAYNGEKYIRQQIQSVLMNFDSLPEYDCRILISDDSSSDSTTAIVAGLSAHDNRIQLLDNSKKGGVRQNFHYLILHSDADYTFFCDQDDLWLPGKMAIFMQTFAQHNDEEPLLLHSDLCVADGHLSPIHPSMFVYQHINKNPDLAALMVSNSVTGCVMACNRALMEKTKASQVEHSIMHDWYIALLAVATGKIAFIDNALILYRQHGNNQVGAKAFSLGELLKSKAWRAKLATARQSIEKTRDQAALFLNDFSSVMKPEDRRLMHAYVDSFNGGVGARAKLFFSSGIRKNGLLRNLFFFWLYVLKR